MALKHALGFLVPWHMLSIFAKLSNSATPSVHGPQLPPSATPTATPPPGQQGAPPLQTPLSPRLSSAFPANPRLALKPQMQKLIACVKQFWHELVLKKPNFCLLSAPVSFCSPNDHFGPFSCPIKKNTKFVPKPPSFKRRPNSLQIPSKLTP
jgi:hypothetical protein